MSQWQNICKIDEGCAGTVVPEREQHRPATPYERIPVTLVEENA
ncbi:hypothetical protein N4Q65_02660 [Salmonella enterica subsp. enterica serovar Pomona]